MAVSHAVSRGARESVLRRRVDVPGPVAGHRLRDGLRTLAGPAGGGRLGRGVRSVWDRRGSQDVEATAKTVDYLSNMG